MSSLYATNQECAKCSLVTYVGLTHLVCGKYICAECDKRWKCDCAMCRDKGRDAFVLRGGYCRVCFKPTATIATMICDTCLNKEPAGKTLESASFLELIWTMGSRMLCGASELREGPKKRTADGHDRGDMSEEEWQKRFQQFKTTATASGASTVIPQTGVATRTAMPIMTEIPRGGPDHVKQAIRPGPAWPTNPARPGPGQTVAGAVDTTIRVPIDLWPLKQESETTRQASVKTQSGMHVPLSLSGFTVDPVRVEGLKRASGMSGSRLTDIELEFKHALPSWANDLMTPEEKKGTTGEGD